MQNIIFFKNVSGRKFVIEKCLHFAFFSISKRELYLASLATGENSSIGSVQSYEIHLKANVVAYLLSSSKIQIYT